MAEWRDLERWLCIDADLARPIALRGGEALHEPALRQRVADWQAALVDLHGRRIALYLDDPFEFAAALLACWQAGCQVVLPADLHVQTVQALGSEVDASIGAGLGRELQPIACSVPVAARPLASDLAALRLFTSGSSGPPQGIDKRLGQLSAELKALQQALGAALAGEAVHATVSHQHIYGLLFRVLWPLCAGRPMAGERLAFPEQIAAALAAGPGVLVSTPAHLARLPELPQWPQAAAQVHAIFSSGGALPAAAAQRVVECLGRAPVEIYGSTETGGIAWRRHAGDDPGWRALPGVRWRIEDERLAICSPFMAEGERWQLSQDRARAEGDSFHLLGRVDRIAKIEQRRVSLTALEQALAADPDVAAARVQRLPGRRDVLGAVIVPATSAGVPAEASARRQRVAGLRSRLREVTDQVCWPRQWRFVAALPVDARGKTSEAALQRLFQAEIPIVQWQRCDADEAQLQCELSAQLQVFQGHFEQAPVLPGVALLDWVGRWAQEAFELRPCFAGMEQIKFQRIARPGTQLNITLHRKKDGARVEFRASSMAGQHASGRLLFGGGG